MQNDLQLHKAHEWFLGWEMTSVKVKLQSESDASKLLDMKDMFIILIMERIS